MTLGRDTTLPRTFGRYELISPLSQGGMGELFLARLAGVAGWQKRVAIKRLLPHLSADPEFLDRFVDEARIAVSLTHGNVVPVFELGVAEGEYFIAMEYIDGWDLRHVLRAPARGDRRVPVAAALYIAVEVCKGLAYAHSRTGEAGEPLHIVHRDISPANLILSREGEVKIVDFGIASARSRLGHTATGQVRGKLAYMSPEQAGGRHVDNRSDLFSLGVVLYEMLAGRRPFEAQADHELLARIQAGEHPRLRSLVPSVSPDVEAVVERALAVDVSERYPSAEAMQVDLMNALLQHSGPFTAQDLARWLGTAMRETPSSSRTGVDGVLNEELDRLLGGGGLTPSSRLSTPATGTPVRTAATGSIPTGSATSPGGRAPLPAEAELERLRPFRSTPTPGPSPLGDGHETRTAAVPPSMLQANAGSSAPTLAPPAGASRRGRWGVVGGLALGLLAAGAWMVWPEAEGLLEVATVPDGAQVYVDGSPAGVSTLRTRLAAGSHVVRVEREGYAGVEERVEVASGDDTALSLTLEPLPLLVMFESIPAGATVTVEGLPPFTAGNPVQVPLGQTLTVSMTLDGYAPWSDAIAFEAGRTQVSARLEALPTNAPGPDGGVGDGADTGASAVAAPVPVVEREPPVPGEVPTPIEEEMALRRYVFADLPEGATVTWRGQSHDARMGLRVPSTDPAGTIRVEAPGYEPATLPLDPASTPSSQLPVVLQPAAADGELALQFREPPFVGDVEVDGRAVGRWDRTPLRLSAGQHDLVVRNESHGTEHRATVDIDAGELTTHSVTW